METFLQRIKLGRKYIFKKACEWTAVVYAVAGFVSLFGSFEGVFSQDAKFLCKLITGVIILAEVWILCAIIQSVIVGCRNRKKVVEGHNGKNVYVVYGDLFDPQIVDNKKRYICFAVNRCYDT